MIEAEFQIVVRKSVSKFTESCQARQSGRYRSLSVCWAGNQCLSSQSILQTAWLYSLSRMLECYNVSQYITLHPLPSPTMSQCKIPHKRNTNVPICCSYRTTFELELSALCSGHTIHNTIIICQLPPQTLTTRDRGEYSLDVAEF